MVSRREGVAERASWMWVDFWEASFFSALTRYVLGSKGADPAE
jgi:hypothetical protein